MNVSDKYIGPFLIANFADAGNPMFFVVNYRHNREKFGHTQLFALMESKGLKEGDTLPLFAMWPDAEGVCVFDSVEEAKAMISNINAHITEKIICDKIRVVPAAVLHSRFFTEVLFGVKWERDYWLHRRYRRWKAKGHFRRSTLLRLREAERLSNMRRQRVLLRDGRYKLDGIATRMFSEVMRNEAEKGR